VVIELLGEIGCKKQTNADGSELYQWSDGTLIKHSNDVCVRALCIICVWCGRALPWLRERCCGGRAGGCVAPCGRLRRRCAIPFKQTGKQQTAVCGPNVHTAHAARDLAAYVFVLVAAAAAETTSTDDWQRRLSRRLSTAAVTSRYVMKLPSGNVVQYDEKEHVKIFQNPDGIILQVQGSSDIVNIHDGSDNE
jgi:hypothetical protein